MIAYLRGKVVLFRFGFLILDVNGVGYRVNTDPQIAIAPNIVDTQAEIELFVHQHIREDSSDLYGFLIFQELELFELLITVSGVGPKAGLAIMASGKTDQIVKAILTDNMGFFTAISGIGKKVSAKIILELKSKLSSDKSINILSGDENSDLSDTLESLGYKRSEISLFINKIPDEIVSIEDKIKWCLKNLSRK
ncbi:MAG: Holliday junction branch migration protein RuvA [Candidatus Berkelbacteria bacterium]|nr:Holliday junction branch migration protein RuvA [Candidatus Berkelbacteria bacterium]